MKSANRRVGLLPSATALSLSNRYRHLDDDVSAFDAWPCTSSGMLQSSSPPSKLSSRRNAPQPSKIHTVLTVAEHTSLQCLRSPSHSVHGLRHRNQYGDAERRHGRGRTSKASGTESSCVGRKSTEFSSFLRHQYPMHEGPRRWLGKTIGILGFATYCSRARVLRLQCINVGHLGQLWHAGLFKFRLVPFRMKMAFNMNSQRRRSM